MRFQIESAFIVLKEETNRRDDVDRLSPGSLNLMGRKSLQRLKPLIFVADREQRSRAAPRSLASLV